MESNRKNPRTRYALITILCWAAFSAGMPRATAESPPNVVVILADDVGWGDLGCYGGSRIKTPHLVVLARKGMRFENGYASASVCTPTRYSMLTGQYSWRRQAAGLNQGVANGDAALLIPVGMPTLPGFLKSAGYRTGAVGKWHLGLTTGKPDYNKDLTPGPLEVGFDQFFGFPATNDRMPPVFIRDHRVVGLDPADPIQYSYDEREAKSRNLTRLAGGRQRIGWMSGGSSAIWKDTEIADTLTKEAVAFIERNHKGPFFLYFAPHDCHAPTIPSARFANSSALSARADMIQELDWSVGEVLAALEKSGVADRTLVVFSSDNGAYVVDEDGHRPNGVLRGEKSQLWEGGFRVPLIARWPGRIRPGLSSELACLVDLPATVAAMAGVKLPDGAAPDSFNLWPVMSGEPSAKGRDQLILMGGTGGLAVRRGPWKFIPDLAIADGWRAGKKGYDKKLSGPGLFNLETDPAEAMNLASERPEILSELVILLEKNGGDGRKGPGTASKKGGASPGSKKGGIKEKAGKK